MLFLDVALGLVLVFFVASLVCTSVTELIASGLRLRATTLKQGLEAFLGSDAAALYSQPLIKSLRTPAVFGRRPAPGTPYETRDPSYIPTNVFVVAMMNHVFGEATATAKTTEDFISAMGPGVLREDVTYAAIQQLVRDARGDVDKVKQGLASWFDASMDRVTGFYKRRAQVLVGVVSIGVAVLFNIDTVEIVQTLSKNSVMRAALVASAERLVEEGPPSTPPEEQHEKRVADRIASTDGGVLGEANSLQGNVTRSDGGEAKQGTDTEVSRRIKELNDSIASLETLGVPLGWSMEKWDNTEGTAWLSKILGLLLTACATSLGAPFWFDLLSKLVSLRSAVKPREDAKVSAASPAPQDRVTR